MNIQDKVEDIFTACSNAQPTVDFYHTIKYFWSMLDNSLSLCDFSSVFTVVNPFESDVLNLSLFSQFLNGISRIKYPYEITIDRFLSDIQKVKTDLGRQLNPNFQRAMDKSVMRVLLKFDMPLRRIFANFAGRDITVGGGLTWDEVKRMDVGMEIDGFVALAGAHSLIPSCLTTQQCTALAKDVASKYPVAATVASDNSVLAYPQFQLLLCYVAIERFAMLTKDHLAKHPIKSTIPISASSSIFNAKKVSHITDSEYLADMLSDLMKAMGVSVGTSTGAPPLSRSGTPGGPALGLGLGQQLPPIDRRTQGSSSLSPGKQKDDNISVSLHDSHSIARDSDSAFVGEVSMPMSSQPEDIYSSSMKLERQAMLVRLERIFDDIGDRLKRVNYSDVLTDPITTVGLLPMSTEEDLNPDMNPRSASKPVVIGDAVPLPADCSALVEQLLEAALAHHNLGSFQEALKFLEAARLQQEFDCKRDAEAKRAMLIRQKKKTSGVGLPGVVTDASSPTAPATTTPPTTTSATGDPSRPSTATAEADAKPSIDQEMYIFLCKGNVYQSCGDDEQSLSMYIQGWDMAVGRRSADWEVVCLNSIGLLCYFNLRYELALKCFGEVVAFREQNYGLNSADTMTAMNNVACCLYCLSKRGEARVRLERAWTGLSKVIGARHPRTVVVWRNLDKARRSMSSFRHTNMHESLVMRGDADRLIVGGEFTIQAIVPHSGGDSKKKKKGGKGKSKK